MHPFSTFAVDHPKGSTKEFFDNPSEYPEYPLRRVTYPVDYGSIPSHTAEDGADLDLFVGSDHKGETGSFVVKRPEGFKRETKFFHRVTPEEKQQILKEFGPVLHGKETVYKTHAELLAALGKFKKTNSVLK